MKRIQTLKTTIKNLNLKLDNELQAGLDILSAHRLNYGSDGPSHLVVLWWEWPPLHWDDLRTGSTMNFMETPTPGVVPNQDLNGPALTAAIQFVNELIFLKVLIPPPPSVTVVN